MNPYLFLAAVLGSALIGIEEGMGPPPPIVCNAYEQEMAQIPDTWANAIDAFEDSTFARRIFDPRLIDNFVMTKRQELHYMKELTPRQQLELYLDTV